MSKKKAPAKPERKEKQSLEKLLRRVQLALARKLAGYVEAEGLYGFDVGDFEELQKVEAAARVIHLMNEILAGEYEEVFVTDQRTR